MEPEEVQPEQAVLDTAALFRPLHDVPFTVEVELARFELDLQTLLRTREGDVFRTRQASGSPMRLIAGQIALASVSIMSVDGTLAARVDRINTKGDELPRDGAI